MSAKDKALAIISEGRIKYVGKEPLTFRVVGDTDPFEPHTVTLQYDGNLLVEWCTCKAGEFHPVRGRCSHVKAARMVSAPYGLPRRGR